MDFYILLMENEGGTRFHSGTDGCGMEAAGANVLEEGPLE